jgi:hypothetical protein
MPVRHPATILPALPLADALETTRIPRVAGLTHGRTAVVTTRPFRAPHHTSSAVGVSGAGPRPLPGEVLLAHHGILFLDELPEFKRHVLAVWRQPLEDSLLQKPCRAYRRRRGPGRARRAGRGTHGRACNTAVSRGEALSQSVPGMPNSG